MGAVTTRNPGRPAEEEPRERIRRRQTTVAVIATIGGFLFGYDTGVISGALLYISNDFQLTPFEESLVTSSLLLGAAVGGTWGGRLSDSVGRRRVIHFASVLFALGTIGCSLAPGMTTMIISRVVLGLAVGGVSAVVPLYLGEIAPVQRRGRLVNQNQLMIVIGQLSAGVINAILASTVDGDHVWRWMLAIALVPAVVLFFGSLYIPDSPRFLVAIGKRDQAGEVLGRLRTREDAQAELTEIEDDVDAHRNLPKLSVREMLQIRWVKVVIIMGAAVSLCQQFSGVNAIVYYAPTVLAGTGLSENASVTANIAVGAMGVIAVGIGFLLIGRFDRRAMLMTGQIGAAVTHVILGLLFLLPPGTANSMFILAMMVVFVFFQQCFISSVTWLILSELFPMQIRGFGMGISVFFNWTSNFLVSLVFPNVIAAFGSTAGFFMFAVLSVVGFTFTKFILPETRNKTLEELEQQFQADYGR